MRFQMLPGPLLLLVITTSELQKAAAMITLTLKGPDTISKFDGEPQMVLNVTNIGEKAVNLMKDPRGLLSTFPTNKFKFMDESGNQVHPQFVGVKVKYAPTSPDPNNFAALNPGQSMQVSHNLADAYNLSSLNPGKYTAVGDGTFYNFDNSSGTVTPVNATSVSNHTFQIIPEETNPELILDPGNNTSDNSTTAAPPSTGPIFVNCTQDQTNELIVAAQTAQEYAYNTSLYASSTSGYTSRYSTWFGLYNEPRHNLLVVQMAAISSNNFSAFTYDCSCTTSNVYAYVQPEEFGKIYLCGAFWDAPMVGTDSKGGTLVHESSHFTANAQGTEDYAYGQSSCQFLSLINPDHAILNADSHEYYAENSPFIE